MAPCVRRYYHPRVPAPDQQYPRPCVPCPQDATMRRLDHIIRTAPDGTKHSEFVVQLMCTECWRDGEGSCSLWRPIDTPEDWDDPAQVLTCDLDAVMAKFLGALERMAHSEGMERRTRGRHRRTRDVERRT